MIYLDTSGALAHLLVEERAPPDAVWRGPLTSSRLLGTHGQEVALASYDERLRAAARALRIPLYEL